LNANYLENDLKTKNERVFFRLWRLGEKTFEKGSFPKPLFLNFSIYVVLENGDTHRDNQR